MKKKRDDDLAQYRRVVRRNVEESPRERVKRQECEAAELIGGRRHAGSGALATLKSDASSVQFQCECKQTEHESMILRSDWLEKISREASECQKLPMLHIRFTGSKNSDWICIPEFVFKRLVSS